ncbi:hypothetical protein FNV43_RR18979 [Rhamnella rubrinervis]|uniref:3-beta hydroxysteroid dehydrogenase/isomerase domain-containing protein n=1 Tax=Rhamnella rubrinervis TaxID=2594499 RepID=A0A8K0GW43_9ROSA|nr:hypothetical protein FNV43_RR18979 [Rhamnella rubrinervis]
MATEKGKVCVTGGTGFIGSWLIFRLLHRGYSVITTVRSDPAYQEHQKGSKSSVQISTTQKAEAAIEGCTGVFHVATPVDFEGKEPVEIVTKRSIDGALGILKACLNSKTVKRVVYTSSMSTVQFPSNMEDIDEAVLEFSEKNGLEVVTLIPSFVVGPFICPKFPGSVRTTLALLLDEMTLESMAEFLSAKYPEFHIPSKDYLKEITWYKIPSVTSKKLIDCGFKFEYGVEEMFRDAIQCCKEKDYL